MSESGMKDVVLHIGYPKCASSFLKRDFFSAAKDNLIIPRGDQLNLLRQDVGGSAIRASILALANDDALPIVVSNEILAGWSFWQREGASDVCRNWAAAFPESKIVILIRRQQDYVLSAYKYSVYTGHRLPSIESFWKMKKDSIIEKISYDTMISEYQQRFGADRVCVLPSEMLRSDEAVFYSRLEEFTGLSHRDASGVTVPNESPTSWTFINFLRRANVVLWPLASVERVVRRSRQTNRISDTSHRIVVYRALVDRLSWLFRDDGISDKLFHADEEAQLGASNRRSSQLIGIDLERYGYIL